METTEETKVEAFYQWISDIYGTRSIGMSLGGVITREYRSDSKLQFTDRRSKRFRELLKYTFTNASPKIKRKGRHELDSLDKGETYRKALSAIVDFFGLAKKYKTLFDSNIKGEEFKVWGKRLYDCCIFVVDVFFDGNDKLDQKLKKLYKEKVIQLLESEDVTITEDGEMAAEVTKSQHDSLSVSGNTGTLLSEITEFVSLDKPQAQVAKSQRQTENAISNLETVDFLYQPNFALIHREICIGDEDDDDYYTYESFNEYIDQTIKRLSELPDEIGVIRIESLYQKLDELRGHIKHFRHNLSLEKKQYVLSILESTENRFFESEVANANQPVPPKSYFSSEEEWQACYDRRQAFIALEMCITALRRYINNETNKKTD